MNTDDCDAETAPAWCARTVLDTTARSLGLHVSTSGQSILAALVARALVFLPPRTITDREQRLLVSAQQLASDASENTHFNLIDHASLYLALAACSWAANVANNYEVRNAAFVVVLGCSARASANLRVALGVDVRLLALADDDALHPRLRYLVLPA